MLIGARLETHIVALRSLVARNAVRQHDLIGISDMRFARCIGNLQLLYSKVSYSSDTFIMPSLLKLRFKLCSSQKKPLTAHDFPSAIKGKPPSFLCLFFIYKYID